MILQEIKIVWKDGKRKIGGQTNCGKRKIDRKRRRKISFPHSISITVV
jgi:hypothetical protein